MSEQKSNDKELLYSELGRMMGKGALHDLKESNPTEDQLIDLRENIKRFLIGRIISANGN